MNELNPTARMLVEAGRSAPPRPSAAARDHVRAALLASAPVAAGIALGGLAKQSGWLGGGLWSKLIVGAAAAVIGASTVAGVVSLREKRSSSRAGAPPARVALVSSAAPANGRVEPPQPPPAASEVTTPAGVVLAARTAETERVAAPRKSEAAAREQVPAVGPPTVSALGAGTGREAPSTPAIPPPAPLSRLSASPAASAEPAPSVSDELAVLDRVLALTEASRWSAALDALRVYDSRFPSGALRVEAGGLEVLALCGVGRRDEATALARTLRAGSPDSPAVRRLEHSCAAP